MESNNTFIRTGPYCFGATRHARVNCRGGKRNIAIVSQTASCRNVGARMKKVELASCSRSNRRLVAATLGHEGDQFCADKRRKRRGYASPAVLPTIPSTSLAGWRALFETGEVHFRLDAEELMCEMKSHFSTAEAVRAVVSYKDFPTSALFSLY